MRILFINSVLNISSTGRIVEDLGKRCKQSGHQVEVAYGRKSYESSLSAFKIGNFIDFFHHLLMTRLFDKHGQGSKLATKRLIRRIVRSNPDIIHIHNIHGYYINYELLFSFLRNSKYKVIWTLYDCWPFTGHCAYFDFVGCEKWQRQCSVCPQTGSYPSSYFIDASKQNFVHKKESFTGLKNFSLLVHSEWLKQNIKKSFLNEYSCSVIPSAIDFDKFRIVKSLANPFSLPINKKFIIGVANEWTPRKGLIDLVKLIEILPHEFSLIVVGKLTSKISFSKRIIHIERTKSTDDLAVLYSASKVFVNTTYEDNFPTTNLEALACGLPIITYDTGGSPEAVINGCGRIVEKGNIAHLKRAVTSIVSENIKPELIRSRAEIVFNKDKVFERYIDYYKQINKK